MRNMLSHFIVVLSSVAVSLANFSAAETGRSTTSEDQGNEYLVFIAISYSIVPFVNAISNIEDEWYNS